MRHRICWLCNLGQYQRPILEVIRSLFHPLPTATIYFVTTHPRHLLLGLQTLENEFYHR